MLLFQTLNRTIPKDQQLQVVPLDTPVQVALELMKKRGFSQLPIWDGEDVLGIVSYRSFAFGASRFRDHRTNVLTLTVADFPEDLPFRGLCRSSWNSHCLDRNRFSDGHSSLSIWSGKPICGNRGDRTGSPGADVVVCRPGTTSRLY